MNRRPAGVDGKLVPQGNVTCQPSETQGLPSHTSADGPLDPPCVSCRNLRRNQCILKLNQCRKTRVEHVDRHLA